MATDGIKSSATTQEDLRVSHSKTLVNDSSLEMSLLGGNISNTPGSGHPHHQVVCREPVFIPAFDEIRRVALAHAEKDLRDTYEKVQQVDNRLRRAQTWPIARGQDCSTEEVEGLQRERTKLLDRLVDIIPKFDKQVAGELKMQQLHNYSYSMNQGLAATHFMLSQNPVHDDFKASEAWLMLESLEEAHEGTLTQDHKSAKLNKFAVERMKSSGDQCYLQNVYQRRPMTLLERQRGAVAYVNGVARPIRSRLLFWRAMLVIMPVVLVVFFGVGLIGSTQQFSPYFLKQYFIIAVAWSLCSSAILGWYIRLFGGTKTEAAAGFLALMGLWLVVMQLGQVRRAAQTNT